MAVEYSVDTIRRLEKTFFLQKVSRPLRIQRYDPGTELEYVIKGINPAIQAQVKLMVKNFVGGGYAGQVYKVRVLELITPEGPIEGIQTNKSYAMKILIPPSGFSKWFRNIIYAIAFQGPFSLQVNPDAARAGALWQKLIRRGAKERFGSELAVVDIYATFIDSTLGSCGEISEWIEGRTWRFEVDDNLDLRKKWKAGDPEENLKSREYLAKKTFMDKLTKLMHDMGAVELARQYEWWTCKSQPNALKKSEYDSIPQEGLVAVDFRAGLALLPFLPMCPADFKLIIKGILRGSLVQFDRGKLDRLKRFVEDYSDTFSGMNSALSELKVTEKAYRRSLPDISHHHLRLLYSRKLWSAILNSNIVSWKIRNLTDEEKLNRLKKRKSLAVLYYLLGLAPFVGKFMRKLWGRSDYRMHYNRLFTTPGYFQRAVRAHMAESLIRWHRKGRVDSQQALKLSKYPLRYFAHLPLSILPSGLHRFFSDKSSFLRSLDNIFARPFRLYFKAEAREKWLLDMVSQGQKNGMLSQKETNLIHSQIKEPFIQKYLKSLAVHVCTVPVTQIVSVLVAIIYVRLHPELSWQEASVHAGLILGLFQVTPISPGSIVRGLYVTALVLRERNFKDYNIAFSLSFFKYIGYLAFPIQMAYRYPDLARFMAGHWATGAVHIVPVFGERGALLEHAVFDLFYNFPLTVRRRIQQRRKIRSHLRPKYRHIILFVCVGTSLLTLLEILYLNFYGHMARFGSIWWIALWIPAFSAAAVSSGSGGTSLIKRLLMGGLSGGLISFLHVSISLFIGNFINPQGGEYLTVFQLMGRIGTAAPWRIFLFTIVAIIGALIAETKPLEKDYLTLRIK